MESISSPEFFVGLISDAEKFADGLVEELKTTGLLSLVKEVDHICYRVKESVRYEDMKRCLESRATLLSEAIVNGRPIASYKLSNPIRLQSNFMIGVFELPAPKKSVEYSEGFEHIEVVINCDLEGVPAAFPHIKFDTRNLYAEINADIAVRFQRGLVKFHATSLEEVIAAEKNLE